MAEKHQHTPLPVKSEGISIRRIFGPAITVYFDWNVLSPVDLSREYYIVEISPDDSLIPTEYARPNSSGPLHFYLRSGVEYTLNLISEPYFAYKVVESVSENVSGQLIQQHESLYKLVLEGLMTLAHENKSELDVFTDGKKVGELSTYGLPEFFIQGRPGLVEIRDKDGAVILGLKTNLPEALLKKAVTFAIQSEPTRFSLSSIINITNSRWRVQSELSIFPRMWRRWISAYHSKFPEADASTIIGVVRFLENGKPVTDIRQFGFSAVINRQVITDIQRDEWQLETEEPLEAIKLSLQITSAHREFYKFPLIEKTVDGNVLPDLVGFTEEEIKAAERCLFERNRNAFWDQSFIELVLSFKTVGRDWQEFQREVAHASKWEYEPSNRGVVCTAEWRLFDGRNPDHQITVAESGEERNLPAAGIVALKPFSPNRLFACWDIDRKTVADVVQDAWKRPVDDLPYFLKVHEEYLGERFHRSDLDCQIFEMFGASQNIYFSVNPNKCYSAEIVVRHNEKELALTPVSTSIIAPREIGSPVQAGNARRAVDSCWFHFTQREVRHRDGKDKMNHSKAMIHLHAHSPNLFRVEPFRDGFLRDTLWPARLPSGDEVHNPPGEWAHKNCLDSWLPILRSLRKLVNEGIDFQISMDISPPVAFMLSSPRFKDYFSRYLTRVQAYIKGQLALMRVGNNDAEFIWAAERYLTDVEAIDLFYNQELGKDVISAYRALEDSGHLEIITCTATHGMPAELQSIPDTLDSQISLAVRSHERLFGRCPQGIWLAENSYFPGVERFLEKEGLRYFFVESEAVLYGSHCPPEEEFNPVAIPASNVVAFGRSRLGRTQVWDADLGYAGHPNFREYHFRHYGLPVKRITSKTSMDKRPYNPDAAEETARVLARDFHHKLSAKGYEISRRDCASIPLITCSYDAELFGHHWSEGPVFLEELLRSFYNNGDAIGLMTGSHYLASKPTLPAVTPNPSTWGHEAVHVRWTDPEVAWTFIEFEKADRVLVDYLGRAIRGEFSDFQKRLVEQMAAEFIRAQSSDLTFVIMSKAFEEDMRREILKYLNYFYRLKHMVDNGIEDEDWLIFRQSENDMFPDIPDYYQIR